MMKNVFVRPLVNQTFPIDPWWLRTVFAGSCDSVASYKFWSQERNVRGTDLHFEINILVCGKI